MSGAVASISKKQFLLFATGLFAVTVMVYCNVFTADFISWDDHDLLMNNKDVAQFRITAFFTQHYTGNYMPLTMMLHALNNGLFGAEAGGHHVVNLVLHGINGILVFGITLKLFQNKWAALLTAVVFCLHPLQVETVAWVAETKSSLFAVFFFMGIHSYLNYLESGNKRILYVNALLFFSFSLLSKAAAVSFPLCLLAIDLISGRKITKPSLAEKIPFFLLSFVIGIVAIYTQQQDRYINESHAFPFFERIAYAGYAIALYAYKFILPFQLAVIYPYPVNKTMAIVTGYAVLVLLSAIIYFFIRKKKKRSAGAMLFVLANLILVLQLVPFGEVLTADRYMYLPVIGFSWLLTETLKKHLVIIKIILFSLVLLFGTATFIRTRVWQNSINLYADILKNYPDSPMALNSLGAEFMLRNEDEKAYRYLNKAIELNPGHYKYYYNRGLLFSKNNKHEEALKDLGLSIKLNNYPKAYAVRASVYYKMKDYSKAMADAETALRSEPANLRANYALANCYEDLNQLEKALYFYNKVIELNSAEPLFYLRRSIVYGKKNQLNDCARDLETATTLNSSYGEAYYWKGVVKINLKQDPCADLQKAMRLGFVAAEGPLSKYCK